MRRPGLAPRRTSCEPMRAASSRGRRVMHCDWAWAPRLPTRAIFGIDRISERVLRQAERLRAALAPLPGVTLRDQGLRQGGIVTFTHERWEPLEIKQFLGNRAINVSITTVQSTRLNMEARGLDAMVRASVHAITTDAEIEALAGAVEDLIRN